MRFLVFLVPGRMHFVPATVGFAKHEPIEQQYRGDKGLTSILYLLKYGNA